MKHPFTRIGNRKQQSKINPATLPSKKLSFGQSVLLIALASAVLLGFSGWYWYKNVLTDPSRVMSDVLDKSLQTSSVSRKVVQSGNQNKVDQSLFLSFSPEVAARSVTHLEESGTSGNSSVVTETIGTKDTDYVRYESIDVSSRNAPKQNFDNVVKVWGERKQNPEKNQPASFLNDALFVAIPFGNLNNEQRNKIKTEITNVNLYKTTKTETKLINGRPTMTYTFEISPQALVQVLAKYVETTGVGNAKELDPAQYEGAPSTPITVEIDLLSRHINKIEFVDSARTETYSAYNVQQKVELPDDTIGIDELQKRLSEIEQKMQQSTTPQQ
jgi:hypothetical protein